MNLERIVRRGLGKDQKRSARQRCAELTVRLECRITRREQAQLQKLSARSGEKISTIVRRLLRAELASRLP